MRRALTLLTAVAVAAGVMVGSAGSAFADPSATDWRALRTCESGDNYSINTGNGYYGAYQFDLSTWKSVGGTGYPHQASKAEQDVRALALYRMRGWSPWICAALVGLKEDSDGGSGVKPGGSGSGSSGGSGSSAGSGSNSGTGSSGGTGSSSGVPAYPGTVRFGDYSASLKKLQARLGVMGYGSFDGTGWYGAKTRAGIIKLQKKAGLSPATGIITAQTWKAAWNGRYKITTASTPPASSSGGSASYVPATNASCKVGSRTPLPWGGTTMVAGETYRDLQCFQRALGSAYGLTGTGYFGAATKSAVAKLQAKAGLPKTGKVDAATWKAAWTRK